MGSSPHLAANTLKTPRIIPPGATAYGKTLSEWLTTYWRWYYSGADPAQSKVGPVQLLPIPAGDLISGTGLCFLCCLLFNYMVAAKAAKA